MVISKHWVASPVVVFLLVLRNGSLVGGKEPTAEPAEVIRTFSQAWQAPEGYMRPLDDRGWMVRMTAFKQLAEAGERAIPALLETLSVANAEPEVRAFAAQALYLLSDVQAKPALLSALQDPAPRVRLYAIDALSRFGEMTATDQLLAMKDKDPNRDVRSHVRFALERDNQPDLLALRKQVAAYNLAHMNTAKVDQAAPLFELSDPFGNTCRLADFIGKKTIVLIFIYGDT